MRRALGQHFTISATLVSLVISLTVMVSPLKGRANIRPLTKQSDDLGHSLEAISRFPGLLLQPAKIGVQRGKNARRIRRTIPLLFKHIQESRLAVHAILHVAFERGAGRLPVASSSVARGIQHCRCSSQVPLLPCDEAAQKPYVYSARVRLTGVGKALFRRSEVAQCQCHLAEQNQRSSLFRIQAE